MNNFVMSDIETNLSMSDIVRLAHKFMLFEKSAGAVVFYKDSDDKIEYLLLNHGESQEKPDTEYWNFPKGTMEKGESEIGAAKREIAEETGLADLKFLPKFRATERYFCRGIKQSNKGRSVFKTVVFFLAEAESEDTKISSEHIGWEWLCFTAANQRLNFKNSRKVLNKADKFLHNRISEGSL